MVGDYSLLVPKEGGASTHSLTSSQITAGRYKLLSRERQPHCWSYREQRHLVKHCLQKVGEKPKSPPVPVATPEKNQEGEWMEGLKNCY